MINILIFYSINTGAVTSFVAIITMITFAVAGFHFGKFLSLEPRKGHERESDFRFFARQLSLPSRRAWEAFTPFPCSQSRFNLFRRSILSICSFEPR